MSLYATLLDASWLTSVGGIAALGSVYVIGVVIYRVYLSPLSHIPGPKIAAATGAYNAYHDLYAEGGGNYVWVVKEMHEKYGPIVRTKPDVVQINDPAFIEKLYTQSPKIRRERYPTVTRAMQTWGSMLGTQDHDMHRRRRAALNPLFSKANVRRTQPIINETLSNLFRRMDGWARDAQPVEFNHALRASTKDIIQTYAFGEGGQKFLDMEDLNKPFFEVIGPQPIAHLGAHAMWVSLVLKSLPPALMMRLLPRITVFANYVMNLHEQIESVRNAKEQPEHRTIFSEILNSDMPPSEKETMRLGDEALVLVIAGADTTASTEAAIIYHMLSDAEILGRLKAELKTVMPDRNQLPDASNLESLPLLNAIIQECIRLYPGATHRQDRAAPDEDLVYTDPDSGKSYIIPAGTGIGMNAPLINRHPSIYENPDEFIPQRYIDNPKLDKYLMSFSKGTRQCLGINLAYQELQSFTAGIFSKYSIYDPSKGEDGQDGPTLELVDTSRKDVEMYRDYVTPGLFPGSQGIKIRIRH